MNDRSNFLTLVVAALLLSGTQAVAGSADRSGNLPLSATDTRAYRYSGEIATTMSTRAEGATTVNEPVPHLISIFRGCNRCEYMPVLSTNANRGLAW